MVEPYFDYVEEDGTKIRTFGESFDDEDYVWHRDLEDRTIAILSGDNWKLQFDNELPIDLNEGDLVEIPKMVYHRLIKGTTDLQIRIWENGKGE